MTNKEFKIDINASADKVWFALWDDYHYRNWSGVFCEGSYMVSDMKEGSKVHFLSPGGEGMYSTIEVNKLFEKMYFRHNGEIKNFEEQPLNEDSKLWSGSKEYYLLSEKNGITTLNVSMDIVDKYLGYFTEAFPRGLSKVKQIAENLVIVVETDVNAEIDKVWNYWTDPVHIVKWNNASDDWHTTKAENDLKTGGKFLSRMEAKDGSAAFDFTGTYNDVKTNELISYKIEDGRNVKVEFMTSDNHTKVRETFQPEGIHSPDLQKTGWQSILDNFKKHTEEN